MKSITVALLASTIVLGGCVAQSFHIQQNIPYDKYERDIVSCRTSALQNVPNNSVTSWMPYVGIYTTDTNEQLRQSSFNICMRDRGYQELEVPLCSGVAAAEAREIFDSPTYRQTRMNIQANSCYIVNASGHSFYYSAPINQ